AAEIVDRGLDDVGAAFGARHAVMIGDGLAAGLPDGLDDDIRRRARRAATVDRAAEIVDDDLGAARRQHDGVRTAEPAPRPGHHGNAAIESNAHAIHHSEPKRAKNTWILLEHRSWGVNDIRRSF